MGRLALMVRKDLIRQIRAPLGIGFVLAFPLIFSLLLAITFGGGGDNGGFPRPRLLVEDRDGSLASGLLLGLLESEEIAAYVEIRRVGADGTRMMERGEGSALLIVPERFGADFMAGRPLTLALVRNPSQGILPEIAEQGIVVIADLLDTASRVLRDQLAGISVAIESGDGASAGQVAEIAAQAHAVIASGAARLAPPLISLDPVRLEATSPDPDREGSSTAAIFLVVLPGVSVWALFMLGDQAMRDVITESRLGTLRRQLSAPISTRDLVVGKALYTAVLASLSLVILSTIGWIVAPGGIDPAGFVVLSAALILAVTGFASVVYGAARTERQGGTLSSIVLLVFAFMGGSFLPIDSMPDSVRRLAPFSPFYWGTTGYTALIRDGAGLLDLAVNVAILTALGVILLGVGSVLLGRKIARGATA